MTVLISMMLAGCNCREAGPRIPTVAVPPVERTEVSGNACYGDSERTIALDLSARNELFGTVTDADGTATHRGRRSGPRIRLGPMDLELVRDGLVVDPEGTPITLPKRPCP